MKKKTYIQPSMDVVDIHAATPLLAYSNVIGPGGENLPPAAPGMMDFPSTDTGGMENLLFQ